MAAISTAFIVFAAILTLAAAIAGLILWRTLTPPRRALPGPACRRCRYPVAGLVQPACPECGARLDLGGTITPLEQMRRRGHLGWAILAFTYLAVVLFALASWGLRVWIAASLATETLIRQQATLQPSTGAFQHILAKRTSDSRVPYAHVTIDLTDRAGQLHQLEFTDRGAVVLRDPASRIVPVSSTTDRAVDALFRAAGADLADPVIRAEAAQLASWLDTARTSRYAPIQELHFTRYWIRFPSTSTSPLPPASRTLILPVLLALAALVSWLVGIGWIVRRRRRLITARTPISSLPAFALQSAARSSQQPVGT